MLSFLSLKCITASNIHTFLIKSKNSNGSPCYLLTKHTHKKLF